MSRPLQSPHKYPDIARLIKEAAAIVGSSKDLYTQLGVTRETFYMWRAGRTKPSPQNARKIETLTRKRIKAAILLPEVFG